MRNNSKLITSKEGEISKVFMAEMLLGFSNLLLWLSSFHRGVQGVGMRAMPPPLSWTNRDPLDFNILKNKPKEYNQKVYFSFAFFSL